MRSLPEQFALLKASLEAFLLRDQASQAQFRNLLSLVEVLESQYRSRSEQFDELRVHYEQVQRNLKHSIFSDGRVAPEIAAALVAENTDLRARVLQLENENKKLSGHNCFLENVLWKDFGFELEVVEQPFLVNDFEFCPNCNEGPMIRDESDNVRCGHCDSKFALNFPSSH